MSSSGGGGCENRRATRCWWVAWQEVQQEVQAEDKMAAGDSAEREQEPIWRLLPRANSLWAICETEDNSPYTKEPLSPTNCSSTLCLLFYTLCYISILSHPFYLLTACFVCRLWESFPWWWGHPPPTSPPTPTQTHTISATPPSTYHAVPLSPRPGRTGMCPHVSVPLPVPQLPPQRQGAWIEPHSNLVSDDLASKKSRAAYRSWRHTDQQISEAPGGLLGI